MVAQNLFQQEGIYSFAYANDLLSLLFDPMENGLNDVVP